MREQKDMVWATRRTSKEQNVKEQKRQVISWIARGGFFSEEEGRANSKKLKGAESGVGGRRY
jgi:hypothetical protein